jgi:hypothetical protein
MEGESISASIMAPSQATSLDSSSSTQQEPLRSASDSNSQKDFEFIEVPNRKPIVSNAAANIDTFEIPASVNEDFEDFADFVNESLGILFFCNLFVL